MKKYVLFVQFPKLGGTILNLAISISVTSFFVAYRQDGKFETLLVEDWFWNLVSFLMNTFLTFTFSIILRSYLFAKKLKKIVPSLGKDLRLTIDSVFELVNNSAPILPNNSDKKVEGESDDESAGKFSQESNYNHLAFCLGLAARGNRLIFNPNNVSIQQLHGIKGSISVTMADPSEWLNPTYGFFLLNHYISTLLNRIGSCDLQKLKLSNSRQNRQFRDFLNQQNRFLRIEEVSSLPDIMKGKHVRFYVLKKEVIEKHKGILEALVAGHELFGIYLFIVDYDIISVGGEIKRLALKIVEQIVPNADESMLSKLDFMLSLTGSDDQEVVQITYREGNKLTVNPVGNNQLDTVQSKDLVDFLNKLRSAIAVYPEFCISPRCQGTKRVLGINHRNCHIYYDALKS